MKKLLIPSILLCLLSCQEQLPEKTHRDINVEEVKNHFQNSILPHVGRTASHVDVVWDLASYRDISLGDALVFPLDDDRQVVYDSTSTFSHLPAKLTTYAFAYKLDNVIHMELVKLIPTRKSEGFTGAMIVENWQGEKLRYFEYENGDFLGEFEIRDSEEARGRTSEFVYTCTTTIYYTCWGEIPEDCRETDRETTCVLKEVRQIAGPGTNGEDYGTGGDGSNSNQCPHPFLAGQFVECPESECPPGQEIVDNECTPVCAQGYERMEDGNCVEKNKLAPCLGSPLENLEITSSGASGRNGGRYGCTRNGTSCPADSTRKSHDGLDLTSNIGRNVYSIYSGNVIDIKSSVLDPLEYKKSSYGNYVTVETTNSQGTFIMKYNHLDYISVSLNQNVSQGTVLGKTGTTGNAGGKGVTPHLHLQTRKKVGSVWEKDNPESYINAEWDSDGELLNTPCNQ